MTSFSASRRQSGLSLIGLLFFGAIAVLIVVLGMRVLPTVLEYTSIKRAIYNVASSGVTGTLEIQKAFDRQAAIDDIVSIGGKDLLIEKDGQRVVITFRYEKRIPLFGPATLLLDYEGSSTQ